MKYKYAIIILLAGLFFLNDAKGQRPELADKFKTKTLNGYFLLVRQAISKNLPSDVGPPTMAFDYFFLKTLSDTVFESLQIYERPEKDSLTFFAPALIGSPIMGNQTEHLALIDYLKKYNYNEDDSGYRKIINYSAIPQQLINGNERFVSIFKGNLTVVGPFSVWQHPYDRQLRNLKVYMYLPLSSNFTRYMYSVVY